MRKIKWPSAFILLLALQQGYTGRVDATESPPTPVGFCEKIPYETQTGTSSTVTTIVWIGTVIAAFMIGRHHAKMQRSAPSHDKLGAAAAADATMTSSSASSPKATTTTSTHVTFGGIVLQQRPTKSEEPPKETGTPQEGKSAEEEEDGRPDEPEVTTRAVATQSQCTYTRHSTQPRFRVLPESGSGAYAG